MNLDDIAGRYLAVCGIDNLWLELTAETGRVLSVRARMEDCGEGDGLHLIACIARLGLLLDVARASGALPVGTPAVDCGFAPALHLSRLVTALAMWQRRLISAEELADRVASAASVVHRVSVPWFADVQAARARILEGWS